MTAAAGLLDGRRATTHWATAPHLGTARFENCGGNRLISMDATQGTALTRSLAARRAIPVRYASWEHFAESEQEISARFTEAGVADRLHWLIPKKPETLG